MSSRYEGRHRGSSNGRRIPQSFRPGFVLPTAAAATLVLTATGASMAESAPIGLDLTGAQARAKAESAALARSDRLEARQTFELKMAASQSRVVEEQRASRDQARTALLKQQKAAAAKKAAAAAKAKALAAAEAKRKAERRWVSPIAGAAFTSGYGMRWGRMHQGNDFGCPVGTPVVAMSKGTVTFVGQESGYGNKVEIEYWDGTVSYYAHLDSFNVTVGQQVESGELVARSGNTGHSTGPHLHLEIHPDGGGAIDPAPWLHAHGIQ
ncbi:M23 family metallopeptidase [Phycicoccus sp. SLBN-51]|uniref:M23 family metallopeptidase n=1 Tax=Phycicoccus sp. SLBN-51 TaxID=2768447 RepID=UPI001152A355|nr:M23 family metallopeptidase [Phycicoccus sp. SLBN-51]TQJ51965.1 murein DD-endopeptidase MepM/ murein hydrolase activator NlpD [Phycicoccus sp. SLBN-51]